MTVTALLVLQVPWVRCVADCHDSIHPDLGFAACHPAECQPVDPDRAHAVGEPSRSEVEHTVVLLLYTVRPQPLHGLPELSASPGVTVLPGGCEPLESAHCTQPQPARPETPSLRRVVLLL